MSTPLPSTIDKLDLAKVRKAIEVLNRAPVPDDRPNVRARNPRWMIERTRKLISSGSLNLYWLGIAVETLWWDRFYDPRNNPFR